MISLGANRYIPSPVLIPLWTESQHHGNGFNKSLQTDEILLIGLTISFRLHTGLVATTLNGSLETLLLVSKHRCHLTGDELMKSIGITVGCVVVPQSMAYAGLAELEPQFGLYSSFMGVLIYWFFATSKDITIGVSVPFGTGTRQL